MSLLDARNAELEQAKKDAAAALEEKETVLAEYRSKQRAANDALRVAQQRYDAARGAQYLIDSANGGTPDFDKARELGIEDLLHELMEG